MYEGFIKGLAVQFDPVETCTSSGSNVYSPGDVVSGSVSILDRNIDLCEFYLECCGNVLMYFNVDDCGGGAITICRSFKVFEGNGVLTIPFLTDCSNLQGYGYGERKFPFKFTLPRGIPSSYKGNLCKIEYSIQVVAKVLHHNHELNKIKFDPIGFQISAFDALVLRFPEDFLRANSSDNSLYLQGLIHQQIPLQRKISKKCDLAMPMTVEAWMNKRGYVQGEEILFNAKIGFEFKSLATVQLVQCVIFSDGKQKQGKEENILWKKRHKMRFIDKEIQISDKIRILTDWVPSTRRIISQSTESFIDVSYFIKLIVNPGFFHSNIVERFDIVIGKFHFPNTVQEEQNSQNATFDAADISANSPSINESTDLNNRELFHRESMQLENQDVSLTVNSVNSAPQLLETKKKRYNITISWFMVFATLLYQKRSYMDCSTVACASGIFKISRCYDCFYRHAVTVSLLIAVALCLFFLFWICRLLCCIQTTKCNTTLPLPLMSDGLHSNHQLRNQDVSLTDVVTYPQSVQIDGRPEQCPSYNELLREMRTFDLDNPPPSYEQCKNDEMILSASQLLTEVTPVTHEPLRLAINCDPENETCQVVPSEIGTTSATPSDGVITVAVCFDANDLETQSIAPSQNS